jgi:hypothetical protein
LTINATQIAGRKKDSSGAVFPGKWWFFTVMRQRAIHNDLCWQTAVT